MAEIPTSSLIRSLCSVADEDQMRKLLDEILTDNERRQLDHRWRLMEMLHQGKPQREVATDLGISLCKITRGSKILKTPESVAAALIRKSSAGDVPHCTVNPVVQKTLSGEKDASSKIIALFGGAFDPIHADHLRLAWECLNFRLADEVWFVPSPDRWDKSLSASQSHRVDMLTLALEGEKRFRLCLDELEQGGFRGTWVFIQQLRERYSNKEFRLLVGADSYSGIPFWRDPQNFKGSEFNGGELLKSVPLIVFPRPGVAMPDAEAHSKSGYAKLYSFEHPAQSPALGSVSSSEVRNRLRKGTASGLIPFKVQQYIMQHGLYT